MSRGVTNAIYRKIAPTNVFATLQGHVRHGLRSRIQIPVAFAYSRPSHSVFCIPFHKRLSQSLDRLFLSVREATGT